MDFAEYVVGFLFSIDRRQVVLIQKKRPSWQAGRYNGPGGRIEAGETAHEAMRREFAEETGVSVRNWHRFCSLSGKGRIDAKPTVIYFFRAFGGVGCVASLTDERVEAYHVDALPNVLPNLTWLIPMALSVEDDLANCFCIQEMY